MGLIAEKLQDTAGRVGERIEIISRILLHEITAGAERPRGGRGWWQRPLAGLAAWQPLGLNFQVTSHAPRPVDLLIIRLAKCSVQSPREMTRCA